MNKSESIKNIAAALKKAQSEMGEVAFDATNPFFKSRYASLGAVIRTSKDALINNGLSVSQQSITNEFGVGVTTLLMHDSGEWIESTVTLPVVDQKNLAQEAGKTITYLRRYSLASLLNLYSDEDNDGNEQKKPAPKPATMSLEAAENEVGSDGKRYGDSTDEELNGKMIGITKALNNKDITEAQRTEYLIKRDAIKMIQAHRKSVG